MRPQCFETARRLRMASSHPAANPCQTGAPGEAETDGEVDPIPAGNTITITKNNPNSKRIIAAMTTQNILLDTPPCRLSSACRWLKSGIAAG